MSLTVHFPKIMEFLNLFDARFMPRRILYLIVIKFLFFSVAKENMSVHFENVSPTGFLSLKGT